MNLIIIILLSLNVVLLVYIIYQLRFFKKLYNYFAEPGDGSRIQALMRPNPNDETGCPKIKDLI